MMSCFDNMSLPHYAFSKYVYEVMNILLLTITSCRGIIDTSIEVISKGCINLKQLCLRRCCFVSDNGLVAFAKVVVSLESLMLEEHNRFTQSGIIVALTNIKIKFSLSLVKCMGVKDIDMEVSMLSPCESLRPLVIQK